MSAEITPEEILIPEPIFTPPRVVAVAAVRINSFAFSSILSNLSFNAFVKSFAVCTSAEITPFTSIVIRAPSFTPPNTEEEAVGNE